MNKPLRFFICIFFVLTYFMGCHSDPKPANQTTDAKIVDTTKPNPSEIKEFDHLFELHTLPYALPVANSAKANELDKKYITDLLTVDFMPAFGKDDVLPQISEDLLKSKYYAMAKLKLDSFDGYIIHKQGDDDYYFLCIFDKQGKFTDGTWIAFTEGSGDDGTVREASINEDGSIEISQYNMVKGRADKAGAERHFYEITSKGKIRDLKDNATPGNA